MKQKTILIDSSLTGGRGPAKQAYEFAISCQERGIPYVLLTNKSFAYKLQELGLNPDIVLDIELSDPKETIYDVFNKALKKISFDLLVKFGARTASSYTSYQLNKPFVVVDGGLPDQFEEYPSLYAKEGYINAKKYILTTHFPWKYPKNRILTNIALGTYPFSQKTLSLTRNLRSASKSMLIKKIRDDVPEIGNTEYDILINLLITGDYVMSESRKTYRAWLTTNQYDEVVGFIRRFITDLSIQYNRNALVYIDTQLLPVIEDLEKKYKNITLCVNRKKWNYETEIILQRLADVVVSRATNYIPNLAMAGQGGLITTPVPANGYMDEDTAAYQAYALGFTELIQYNDENYMEKFLLFAKDKKKQGEISKNLTRVSDKMIAKYNTVDLILKEL